MTSKLSDGHPVWHHVALLVHELGEELVGERGLSSVGAVIGATHPRAVGEARRLLPQAILLLPGVGAQGATPADLARAFTSGPASALVNASRSVIYAFRNGQEDWRAPPRPKPPGCGGRSGPSPAGSRWSAAGDGRRTRYGAPAAFLLAVTIAVLLVRSGLQSDPAPAEHPWRRRPSRPRPPRRRSRSSAAASTG